MAEPAQRSGDRLPWLTEVPQAPPAQPTPKRRRRQLPLLAFLLGAMFALIGVGAYWLGSRQPGTVEPAEEERPGMAAQEEHAPVQEAPLAEDPEEPVPEKVAAVPRTATTSRSQAAPARPRVVERPTIRQVPPQVRRSVTRPRQQASRSRQQASPALALPVQPVVRGRLIQTGAFATRAQAEADWQRMVRKWPYLASKPRLIAPILVRSTDGKATHMYRVQLATASQAQSVVICQQLTKVRQSCVVVY